MNKFKFMAVPLLAFALSTPALALTLGEKNQLAEWNQYMAEEGYGEHFKKHCGYDMPVTLDESLVPPFVAQNTSASSYCDEVRGTMYSMCEESPISKEAIAGKIKALSCQYKEGETKGSFAITPEGTLTFSFDVGTPNIGEITKAYLEKNL